MPLKDQFGKRFERFERLGKRVTLGKLVDSPTKEAGESIFEYEYLREFEAKIVGTARKVA
jgi:hypothetical protein